VVIYLYCSHYCNS